jgi:uncharacterized protein (TIGR00297 family)
MLCFVRLFVTMRYGLFFASSGNNQETLIPEAQHNPAIQRVSDLVALAFAFLLLVIFVWIHGRGPSFYLVLAITLAFAAIGRIARGVNTSGALAGAAIAFITASRELKAFWVLLIVFLLTLAATRLGRSRKQQLRVAESRAGRSAAQVVANLGVAALLLSIRSSDGLMLLALAAMAEAAADTVSSETGSAFPGKTVLITTWQEVAPGTDGGISAGGTFAGALAALIVAAASCASGLLTASQIMVVASAGTAGMLVDSALGAAFERRGYLNNDLVNLLGTAAAAGAAWLAR